MNDLTEITEILRHHPWSPEAVARGYKPILSSPQAEERAKMLVRDMAAIECNWPIRSRSFSDELILSYYEVPDTDFGKMDEENVREAQKADGFGLTWGSVIRLSKVCEIGRKYFGSEWPARFRKPLLKGKDHLAFVEEFLWLNLWYGVTDIDYESQPFLDVGCEKRIDWRFKSCGQIINLEVKYRPRDWMRHVDGPQFNIVMRGYYYDVPDKFPEKRPDELNLVAVSSPASIDRSWRLRTETLLRENPQIDGVLMWAQASSSDYNSFEIQSVRKKLIETFFTYGDFEDAAHIGTVFHLWRNRDARRAYRAPEVPELLQKLSQERWKSNRSS